MGASNAMIDEGYASFRDYRTWYRVTGDLRGAKTPPGDLRGAKLHRHSPWRARLHP